MNTEFATQLALAGRHAAAAVAALVPPGPRGHLEVIGREVVALLADLGEQRTGEASPAERPARRSHTIDIEE